MKAHTPKVSISRRAVLAGIAAMSAAPTFAASRVNAVATTGMIADLVRNVGGPGVEVLALMGAGVDPHAYRQTRSDIVDMTRADAVFSHGLFLEAQMEEFLADLGRKRPVYALSLIHI